MIRRDRANPRNRLLASLSPGEFKRLEPHLAVAHLSVGETLRDFVAPPKGIWFPETCVVSLVVLMTGGGTAVVGMTGCEGVAAYSPAECGHFVLAREVVQVAGEALFLPARVVQAEFDASSGLRQLMLCHAEALHEQVMQLAACNALHVAEERLARFLLSLQDCTGPSAALPLTQEQLAEMLGVRRTTVTAGAAALQRVGLITYRRGTVEIKNRRGLEAVACECYGAISILLRTMSARSKPLTVLHPTTCAVLISNS